MPRAGRFLGLTSCWGCRTGDDGDIVVAQVKVEEKEKPAYDFSKHPEHKDWALAVAAAAGTKYRPTPEDSLVPWSPATTTENCASEVCTLTPAPGRGRATLFLRTTLSPETLANRLNRDFFKYTKLSVKTVGEAKEENKKASDEESSSEAPCALLVPDGGGTAVLVIETAPGSYMYGPVLVLTSVTRGALEMFKHLDSIFPTGYACIVPHDTAETFARTVVGNMRLTRRTGVQKEEEEATTPPSSQTLATIFELELDRVPKFENPEGRAPHGIGENVVARAVIAYRDASGWPSVGPTIQSIEVRRDFQGGGLVQDLFNSIERWFVSSWTLSTEHWQRCLKATQLRNYVVDRIPRTEGDDPADENHVLTDKKFFYEVMHFSCNSPNPTDPLGQPKGDTPPEIHAIKYYQPIGAVVPLPTVEYSFGPAYGWRSCDNCKILEQNMSSSLLVCGGCPQPNYWRAHYCSHWCQRENWNVHKLCCGKSHEEVLAGKKALEESILAEHAAASSPPAAAP